MPGFRRDFASDVLRPGLALKVARVGLFFSDLTASTQLYADVGDAAAFKLSSWCKTTSIWCWA
jgi:hypothetical protein